MKKLSLVLALILVLSMFVSCNSDSSTNDAGNDDDGVTTTTTTTTTRRGQNLDPEEDPDDDNDDPLADEIKAFPNATSGDLALEGYGAWGYWEDGVTTDANNLFVFTNDTMKAGKLTATFTGVEGSPSDSGIVFGMEDDVNEQLWYWEDGPAYYMLFVSDAGTLYLSKVSYQGSPWIELKQTTIPGFSHGQEVTISAEFDGEGNIKGYANGTLLFEYTDNSPIEGTRYGVRAEIIDVTYSSVVAEHD